MVAVTSVVNKIIVELFFLFILSGNGGYPMEFEMTDNYDDKFIITVNSEGDNYNITVASEYYREEIYAEWYDVFAYKIYQEGIEPYLADLGYFFEIELTDEGFPEQTYNHPEGGEIYLTTEENYTVIKYPDKGITLKIDNKSYGLK